MVPWFLTGQVIFSPILDQLWILFNCSDWSRTYNNRMQKNHKIDKEKENVIEKKTPHLSIFSPNAGKYRPE